MGILHIGSPVGDQFAEGDLLTIDPTTGELTLAEAGDVWFAIVGAGVIRDVWKIGPQDDNVDAA